MRFSELRDTQAEVAELKGRKRLGKKQTLRLAQLSAQLASQPTTPARINTGLDDSGQAAGDRQGNVYALHSGKPGTLREARRNNRFGRYGIKPLRSRIQRMRRRQRTGGVK